MKSIIRWTSISNIAKVGELKDIHVITCYPTRKEARENMFPFDKVIKVRISEIK